MDNDVDPEKIFWQSQQQLLLLHNQFNMKVKSGHKMSIIHFNSRSLYANFQNIKEYYKVVDFELNGLQIDLYMNRKNKKGGNVAL